MCDTHEGGDDVAAKASDHGTDSFNPVGVPDRFERRVRDDHATNAALHSTLRAVYGDDPDVSINLMGSHAPGEKEHEPRYHVRVSLENSGMGEPSTGPTILDEMVARDDVVITKAYGGARYDDVTIHDDTGRGNDPTIDDVFDAVEGTIEQAVDRLTVHIRPVETRVEPITVDYSDLPDGVAYPVTASGVAVTAYRCHGCERATLPDDFAEIDGDPACPRCGTRVDWDKEPPGDGFDEWEGPVDHRTEYAVEWLRDCDDETAHVGLFRRTFGDDVLKEVTRDGPVTYSAAEDLVFLDDDATDERAEDLPPVFDAVTDTEADYRRVMTTAAEVENDDLADALRYLIHSNPWGDASQEDVEDAVDGVEE